jgi:hypothetical protein
VAAAVASPEFDWQPRVWQRCMCLGIWSSAGRCRYSVCVLLQKHVCIFEDTEFWAVDNQGIAHASSCTTGREVTLGGSSLHLLKLPRSMSGSLSGMSKPPHTVCAVTIYLLQPAGPMIPTASKPTARVHPSEPLAAAHPQIEPALATQRLQRVPIKYCYWYRRHKCGPAHTNQAHRQFPRQQ